ncbi:hypothetical protein GGR55DRAFT_699939 [Xylaria sp. FL0064]|nr:hypothetical protein GGR55DRAFT_699939 [Xylaria sp. FL0064]
MPRRYYTPIPVPSQLYFAYGNNLCLEQMAKRCPNSFYVGRAVLKDYYWHINEMGVANIKPKRGYNVHGLVYELRYDDEARLDRYEGVHHGVYAKSYKIVKLYPAAPGALQMHTRSMVNKGGPDQVIKTARQYSISTRELPASIQYNVLVYLSEAFIGAGYVQYKYIHQMNSGTRDAISLGIPKAYFKNTIANWMPPLRDFNHRLIGHSLENLRAPVSSETRPLWPAYDRKSSRRSRYQARKHDIEYRAPGLLIRVYSY